jgi:hypothetical protein
MKLKRQRLPFRGTTDGCYRPMSLNRFGGSSIWRTLANGLCSIRAQPRDVLLVEKAANLGINFRHLGVGKSAVLAARDCHEHVADTDVVQRLVQTDILRVGNGRVGVSLIEMIGGNPPTAPMRMRQAW